MTEKISAVLLSLFTMLFLFPQATEAVSVGNDVPAVHGEAFIVKENMEFYNDDLALNKAWSSTGKYAVSNGGSSLSLSLGQPQNSYNGEGKSMECTYDFSTTDSTEMSFYKTGVIYNEDLNGEPMGESSCPGFWIKTSSALKLRVRMIDTLWESKYTMTTASFNVDAGESFVVLDWKDFIPADSTLKHDYYQLVQLQFLFSGAESAKQSGIINIDEIGFYTGTPAVDTHGSGFCELPVDSAKWINKTAATATLSVPENSPRYHMGCTNLADNTTALRLDYSGLSAGNGPNFYYNTELRMKRNDPVSGVVSDNLYGENTVLSFWVHTDQAVTLSLDYLDRYLDGSAETARSMIYSVELPYGESIVNVPMNALVPAGKQYSYYWVYQLQFWLKANAATQGSSGTVYLDAIGFYRTNTDSVLSKMLATVSELTPENADGALDIFNCFSGLQDTAKADITSKTRQKYDNLILRYDAQAPGLTDIRTTGSDDDYGIGTLSLHATLKNAPREGCEVAEIGAVIHRKSLVSEPDRLSVETPDVVRAERQPEKQSDNYDYTIVLKSINPTSTNGVEYAGDGYMRTDYIFRPYVIYTDTVTGKSYTVYGRMTVDAASKNVTARQQQVAYAFDGSAQTAWTAETSGTDILTCEFETPKTFNSIRFYELGTYVSENRTDYNITDYKVEILREDNSWLQIYHQDEMGVRTGILDGSYTAKQVRVTVTTQTTPASIAEISFEMLSGYDTTLRTSSYLTVPTMSGASVVKSCPAIFDLTDAFLFGYGCWGVDGNFVFNDENGESMMADVVTALQAEPRCPELWFCIQNYNSAEIKKIMSDEGITQSQAMNRLLSTVESRRNLINFCLKMCRTYNLAGIDIDYEYPLNQTHWANYDALIKELASALHPEGYKLSVALSPFGITLSADAIKAIDFVNVMAYDCQYTDAYGRHNGYNSNYGIIAYFESLGFGAKQLVLGLGFYGKDAGNTSSMGYSELCRRYPDLISADTNWYGSCYCAGVTATNDKVVWAMQQGIGGVFSWTIRSDLPYDNEFSLTAAVTKTLDRFGAKQ